MRNSPPDPDLIRRRVDALFAPPQLPALQAGLGPLPPPGPAARAAPADPPLPSGRNDAGVPGRTSAARPSAAPELTAHRLPSAPAPALGESWADPARTPSAAPEGVPQPVHGSTRGPASVGPEEPPLAEGQSALPSGRRAPGGEAHASLLPDAAFPAGPGPGPFWPSEGEFGPSPGADASLRGGELPFVDGDSPPQSRRRAPGRPSAPPSPDAAFPAGRPVREPGSGPSSVREPSPRAAAAAAWEGVPPPVYEAEHAAAGEWGVGVPPGRPHGLAPSPAPGLGGPARADPEQAQATHDQRPLAASRPGGLGARRRLLLTLHERWDLDRRAVTGLAVLLVLASGYAVQHFWLARPEPVALPPAVSAEAGAGADTGAGTGAEEKPEPEASGLTVAASSTPAPPEVVVDVSGRVRSPGVRTLRLGARVQDALRAAGGALPGTSLTGLNLARKVTDGEEIIVGPAPPGAPAPAPLGVGPATPLSLNAATAQQLDTLPGLGPVLAQRIVQYRDRHGPFTSLDQLRRVTGFGTRRLADLRPLLRL